jgi:phytoene dehydrogenase-like protein
MDGKQKVVVVGAGPVGSLAALYAANRGHDVEIYELRSGKSLTYNPLSHYHSRRHSASVFPFFSLFFFFFSFFPSFGVVGIGRAIFAFTEPRCCDEGNKWLSPRIDDAGGVW